MNERVAVSKTVLHSQFWLVEFVKLHDAGVLRARLAFVILLGAQHWHLWLVSFPLLMSMQEQSELLRLKESKKKVALLVLTWHCPTLVVPVEGEL